MCHGAIRSRGALRCFTKSKAYGIPSVKAQLAETKVLGKVSPNVFLPSLKSTQRYYKSYKLSPPEVNYTNFVAYSNSLSTSTKDDP